MKTYLLTLVFVCMAGLQLLAQKGSPPANADHITEPGDLSGMGIPSVVSRLNGNSLLIEWTTNQAGTTEAFIGNTPGLEMESLQFPGQYQFHQIKIPVRGSSQLYYVQPFSVVGGDTALGPVTVHITPSASGGEIRTLFTAPVDTTVSLGLIKAEYLPGGVDDELIRYIDQAEESVDVAIYNLNNDGISDITAALNRAHDRGVMVRVVYDSNSNNFGLNTLDRSIGKLGSPKADYPVYGLMHNKFVVFDAASADPMKPLVWTGSTNFTEGQINLDPNNVIVIQDQSLALAYRLEFNEMFGSDGLLPDKDNARFGPDKTDNTPHEFLVGGKRIECYFSPSDGAHQQILSSIASADQEVEVATMLITRQDIGDALAGKHDEGKEVQVVINGYDQYGEPVLNTLLASLGDGVRLKGEPGIMHHKYMIVDQGDENEDPLLLTGSHNWSSSAEYRNDENTLIVHDQGVANAYYQDFVKRFAAGQVLSTPGAQVLLPGKRRALLVYPNPAVRAIQIRTLPEQLPSQLRLIDGTGRVVIGQLPPDTREMDVSGLPEGIYFLHATLENGEQVVQKIMVVR
jgi:phosphatidylserine/phosphatidylglycerophosphate/cardiolipin synthase-like enzyme